MNQYVAILNTKTSSILLGSASACSAWLNCRFFVHVHQENTYKTWTSRLKGPKRNGRIKEIESTFISSINLHHILLCIAHSNIPQPSQPLNPLDEHPGWRQDDCSGGIDISADSPICRKKNENDALASMVVVHQEQHPGMALLLKWINAHSCDYRGFAATMSPAQFAEKEIIAVKWSNKNPYKLLWLIL